jgi:hypothetical protein
MTSKQPGQPNRFWLAFTVSSFEMPIAMAFGLYGLASLVFSDFLTPPSVGLTYEFWLIVIWHLLLALGGWGSAIGRLLEWERLEMSGLAAFGLGCIYYMAAAYLINHEAAFGLVTLLTAITSACAIRMYVLRKSLKAQKFAHNLVDHVVRNGNGDGS